MILLIDNYDSFSYNLVQLCGAIDPDIEVVRNDAITLEDIEALAPDRILLSPGPGRPEDAGITMDVIRAFAGKIPILGVCLGHQAICAAFGADIIHAPRLMHGKASQITRTESSRLLSALPETFQAARYHSLCADEASLPDDLQVTARSEDGQVMAVEHVSMPLFGVQFHPESILTPQGEVLLRRFLSDTLTGSSPATEQAV